MRKLMSLFAAFVAFTVLALPLVATAASAQDDPMITLIHAIPDINVDVEIDGDVAIEDFAFGDREDLSSLAGETLADLRVLAAGTDAVAIDQGDLTLPADGNYTAVAHLDEDGNPVLTVFENDVSEIDAGKGRLTVRHTAAVGPVDVMLDGVVVINGISSTKEASADLNAADMVVDISLAGEEDVIIGPEDISVIEGESIVVYAVGGADGTATVLTDMVTVGGSIRSDDSGDDDSGDDDSGDDDSDASGDSASGDDDDDDDSDSGATDGDDDLSSAPAGVETGNSPITTGAGISLLAVAVGVLAASSAGIVGLRRFDAR